MRREIRKVCLGEGYTDFSGSLDELKKDGGDYILVAHNGIARVVQSYFYEMTNEEYASFGIRNCEIREYRFAE